MDGAAQLADEIDRLCRAIIRGRQASHQLKRLIAHLGVGEVEFRLLWSLRDARKRDQRALANRLAVSSALVSGSVERLRQRQLIAGVRSSDDRRRQEWQLTANGKALLAQIANTNAPAAKEAA